MVDSAATVPLLDVKDFHEGCPGCIVARKKLTDKSPPKKELAIIALVVLCNALPISSLFPFLYYMVRDLGIAKEDTSIGTYAGYIGSAYMFGRFLTSTPWGIFSDRFGRKSVMLIGCGTIVVFNTLFGFSTVYWLALTSRFLLGLCNGALGGVRAYASEICTEEHQALGLSMVGTMWGVGLIIGPAIGGYLAPCWAMSIAFPFLIMLSICFSFQPAEQYPSLFPSGSFFDQFPYALPCLCISAIAIIGFVVTFFLPESIHNHKQVKFEEINETKVSDSSREESPIWKNRAFVATVTLYCTWALHDMAHSEIFSLWAVSPVLYGGLGMTTAEVGDVLAVAGAGLLIFQLFFFPPLAKKFGAIWISRVPAFLTVPLTLIYPLIVGLSGVAMWVILILAAVLKNVMSICFVTGAFIMINNSVVTRQRGVANGISMTFMSLFKAIGPACAGYLFSWAQTRTDAVFLPGMWLVFSILAAIPAIIFVGTFRPFLPSSLTKPVPEVIENKPDDEEKLVRESSFSYE